MSYAPPTEQQYRDALDRIRALFLAEKEKSGEAPTKLFVPNDDYNTCLDYMGSNPEICAHPLGVLVTMFKGCFTLTDLDEEKTECEIRRKDPI